MVLIGAERTLLFSPPLFSSLYNSPTSLLELFLFNYEAIHFEIISTSTFLVRITENIFYAISIFNNIQTERKIEDKRIISTKLILSNFSKKKYSNAKVLHTSFSLQHIIYFIKVEIRKRKRSFIGVLNFRLF